jgi:hypothetical protein
MKIIAPPKMKHFLYILFLKIDHISPLGLEGIFPSTKVGQMVQALL